MFFASVPRFLFWFVLSLLLRRLVRAFDVVLSLLCLVYGHSCSAVAFMLIDMQWKSIGKALEKHWKNIGKALEKQWKSIGETCLMFTVIASILFTLRLHTPHPSTMWCCPFLVSSSHQSSFHQAIIYRRRTSRTRMLYVSAEPQLLRILVVVSLYSRVYQFTCIVLLSFLCVLYN